MGRGMHKHRKEERGVRERGREEERCKVRVRDFLKNVSIAIHLGSAHTD